MFFFSWGLPNDRVILHILNKFILHWSVYADLREEGWGDGKSLAKERVCAEPTDTDKCGESWAEAGQGEGGICNSVNNKKMYIHFKIF